MFGKSGRSVVPMTTFPLTGRTTPLSLLRRLGATLLAGLRDLRRAQLARLRAEALRDTHVSGASGHEAVLRVLREIYGDRLPPLGWK